jgi:nitrogen fixation protein FixH
MRQPVQRSLWPVGIILALVLFAAGLVALIVFATSSNSDLVTEDYYEQEIQYDQKLERLERTAEVSDQVEVSQDLATQRIQIQLPIEHVTPTTQGQIHLYRPAAAGMDRRLPLALNQDGQQWIMTEGLAAGLWQLKIEWNVGKQGYFADRRLVLEP